MRGSPPMTTFTRFVRGPVLRREVGHIGVRRLKSQMQHIE